MAPSIHSLVRQATRERLAAARTISEQSKQYHTALAERYARQAEELARELGGYSARER
ncbi:MAG: hypothetical protein ACJ8FJ_02630 [Sphingomicrobium sp.]